MAGARDCEQVTRMGKGLLRTRSVPVSVTHPLWSSPHSLSLPPCYQLDGVECPVWHP